MKRVSVSTYRKDTLYPKVVKATARLLKKKTTIGTIEVFVEMGNLIPSDLAAR